MATDSSTRKWHLGLIAFAMAAASSAHAERLLAPQAALRNTTRAAMPPPGVAGVRTLALGGAALGDLRARRRALIADFPVGSDGSVMLDLTRIEPFAPGARVEVMEDGRPHALALPDAVYFAGTVRGE